MPASPDDSQRNRRTAKRILAIGLPLVVIAGTGIGYAFWSSTGSGSGSATAAAPAALALSGTVGGLAPGKTVTVPIMATNTNTYRVAIGTLTAAATTAAQLKCGGDATAVDLSIGTPTVTAPFIAASTGPVQVGTVDVTMTDATYNQDGCKGITLGLTFGAS